MDGTIPEHPEKNPRGKARPKNKRNAHMLSGWNQTSDSLVGGEHSHHWAMPAPLMIIFRFPCQANCIQGLRGKERCRQEDHRRIQKDRETLQKISKSEFRTWNSMYSITHTRRGHQTPRHLHDGPWNLCKYRKLLQISLLLFRFYISFLPSGDLV